MPFVYSTLSCAQNYTLWDVSKEVGKPHRAMKTVHIKGGHSIADKKTLVTPIGVVTEVSESDLAALMQVKAFKNHIDAGFIRIEKTAQAPEKVATSDMAQADASSQLSEQDFSKPPTVGAPKAAEEESVILKPRRRK